MKDIKLDFGSLGKYIKIAIYVVLAVVVFLIIRKYVKKYLEGRDQQQLIDKMGQDINPNELTYTDSQYLQFATAIYQALNDRSAGLLGVNEDKIYEIYGKMKTNSDILKTHNEFGRKALDASWLQGVGYDGVYSLAEAIPKFLTGRELRKLNKILVENGITYQYA